MELDPQDYLVLRHLVMKAAGRRSEINHIGDMARNISTHRLATLLEEDRLEIEVKSDGVQASSR